MKKYRICRITDAFPPPWSGLNPGPYYLSLAQQELGNDVVVIAKRRPESNNVDRQLPFPVIRSSLKKDLFDFAACRLFLREHKKTPFDVLHTHGSSIFWIQLLNRRLKLIDIPIVVSVHNIRDYQNEVYRTSDLFSLTEQALARSISREKNACRKTFAKRLLYPDGIKQRVCYCSADMLVPVNHNLATYLESTLGVPKAKIRTIPNGVEKNLFGCAAPVDLSHYGVSASDKVLLFVGRLTFTKDLASLIVSMTYLRDSHTKLVIIGDGPLRSLYEEMVSKQKLSERIVFTGNLSHTEIPGFYARADLFVFTSFSEGIPKVVLEAMAAGKPVLAADVEGVRDLVKNGENGFLFPPNSPRRIAELASDVLRNPDLLSKLGRNNVELVNEQYTWERIAGQFQSAYMELDKTRQFGCGFV